MHVDLPPMRELEGRYLHDGVLPARHFSMGNAEGPRPNDLPLLLRQLAHQIEDDDIKMNTSYRRGDLR